MAQPFDTPAAAKRLTGAGMSREQAEAIAETVTGAQGDLATKADLRADLAVLKADMTWRMFLVGGAVVAAVKFIP